MQTQSQNQSQLAITIYSNFPYLFSVDYVKFYCMGFIGVMIGLINVVSRISTENTVPQHDVTNATWLSQKAGYEYKWILISICMASVAVCLLDHCNNSTNIWQKSLRSSLGCLLPAWRNSQCSYFNLSPLNSEGLIWSKSIVRLATTSMGIKWHPKQSHFQ